VSAMDAARPEILQQLDALRTRGQQMETALRERFAAVQAQLGEATDAVSARVTVDERGFPVSLDLVDESGAASPDQVRAALTTAFVAARTANPSLPVEAVEPLLESIRAAAADPARAAERLAAQGVTLSNDLGQVSVTALYGDVTTVDAKDAWLQSVPTADIAADVLGLAQRAATASDRFGRFSEKEDDRG
jgi:hypothetical protein